MSERFLAISSNNNSNDDDGSDRPSGELNQHGDSKLPYSHEQLEKADRILTAEPGDTSHNVVCPFCDKRYATKFSFARHFLEVHENRDRKDVTKHVSTMKERLNQFFSEIDSTERQRQSKGLGTPDPVTDTIPCNGDKSALAEFLRGLDASSSIELVAAAVNGIVAKKELIKDASSADAVISCLRNFTVEKRQILRNSRAGSHCDLLRTAEVRDLIIDVLAPKISQGEPVENLGRTINNITNENKTAAELFSNKKSFAAILDCFHRATTAESAQWIATCVNNICIFNPGANKILNDLPVVEAFSAIIPYATTNGAVQWISYSIETIVNGNPPAQNLFGTQAVLETIKTMDNFGTSYSAQSAFAQMMDTLESGSQSSKVVQQESTRGSCGSSRVFASEHVDLESAEPEEPSKR